ncbi:purine-binding chemotaxis protein CheW [Desulfacinum hydrothermale DSM 13146]|uniref:Purine-binding chemotaxis protein CheW n=1 Tax=Desulfacinum hydrothermale DSM 13146 TaxID=1121390 RepID=A0A1W1XAT3_9BACT|nr:chemotaxis protein CheW [Desulfacinum hydrothermale]SMC20808.1 purine-binding chemotaxis protein CheW [Desulfacinum hydrothermale DSM 13146]
MEHAKLAILRERAKALAGTKKGAAKEGDDFLVFSVAGERFGLRAGFVREVVRVEGMTRLPGVPSHVLGVVNVRGEIIPVADLMGLLGTGATPPESVDRVLILAGGDVVLGLAVDEVEGMHRIDGRKLQPAPSSLGESTPPAVVGLTPDRILVVDARELLSGSSPAAS